MHSERLAYIEKLNNEEELSVQDVAGLIAEVKRLRSALEIFALDANWRLNHRCDPNGPYFDGLAVAQAALEN